MNLTHQHYLERKKYKYLMKIIRKFFKHPNDPKINNKMFIELFSVCFSTKNNKASIDKKKKKRFI